MHTMVEMTQSTMRTKQKMAMQQVETMVTRSKKMVKLSMVTSDDGVVEEDGADDDGNGLLS